VNDPVGGFAYVFPLVDAVELGRGLVEACIELEDCAEASNPVLLGRLLTATASATASAAAVDNGSASWNVGLALAESTLYGLFPPLSSGVAHRVTGEL
jgi:hypothetical protein